MRILAATTLASLLCLACGDNGDMQITLTMTTPESTGSGDPSGNSNSTPGTTQEPTTTAQTTTTSDPVTTAAVTTGNDTGELTTSTSVATSDTGSESSTGADDGSLMKTYGAPCDTDADCQKLLGDGGKCLKDILGVYALPGGYCSTLCQLPDQQTTYITDAPDCLMMADCIGLMGYFEGCAHACTDDAQCPRAGYECRRMPQLSNMGDPEFCLMTEDNMIPP